MPGRQSLVVHLGFLLLLVAVVAGGTAFGPALAAPAGESSRPRIRIVAPSRERVVIGETRFAVEATAAQVAHAVISNGGQLFQLSPDIRDLETVFREASLAVEIDHAA